MRVRTAKQRAQRIDLNYFKHPHGMKRWRILLSLIVPVAALLYVTAFAAAGSRKPYSPGPVSSAHGFTEMKCEACHTRRGRDRGLPRAHDRRRLPDLPRRAQARGQRNAGAGLLDLPPGAPRPRPAREDGRRVLRRVPWRSEDDARRPEGREERQRVSLGASGIRRGQDRRAGPRPAALQPRRPREGLDPRARTAPRSSNARAATSRRWCGPARNRKGPRPPA